MNPSDFWFKIIFLSAITLYTIALVAGLINHRFPRYVLIINALSGLIVLIYWTNQQFRITQHYFELREMIFLGYETLTAALAIYSLYSYSVSNWLRVLQNVFFFIQFILLIGLGLFMLLFKMDKLI